jgi:inosose dehydratase
VEFPKDPRNPPWRQVLKECAEAGYRGIELGPVGYMPENPVELAEALDEHGLTLIGGVVFRPFHDPDKWLDVVDGAERTCKALASHGAQHLVLIDSISARRAATAGRAGEAEQMDKAAWTAFRNRIVTIAKMGAEVYGLTVSIHAHAGGFMEFEPELERLLNEVDASLLKICFDTGHHSYAGYDPVAFMKRHLDRIAYIHFKDADPAVKAEAIRNRTDFYEACGQGIFCNLGKGDVNFQAVRRLLVEQGYAGWCTVEQDCDPTLDISPIADARANRDYLTSIGFD